jgi:predicted O-methyltransferase YrrM
MDFHSVPAEVDDDILAVLCEVARAMKPKYIVESGTYMGKFARALSEFGRVDTCDPCFDCWNADRGFDGLPITAHLCRGIDFTPRGPIGLLFIDSDINTRAAEFRHFVPFMAPRSLIAIDDPGCFDYSALEGHKHMTLPIKHGLIVVA